MSKVIVKIDIPTDYADEYKQWIIEGRLCYLEDNAWTHLKDVECKVEPYREVIPVEWIEKYAKRFIELENRNYFAYRGFSDIGEAILNMLENWEEENEK